MFRTVNACTVLLQRVRGVTPACAEPCAAETLDFCTVLRH